MLDNWGVMEAELASIYPGLGYPLHAPWMYLRRLIGNLPQHSRMWGLLAASDEDGQLNGSSGQSGELRRPAWRDQLEMALHGRITKTNVVSADEWLAKGQWQL